MAFNLGDIGKVQKPKHDRVFNTETMLPISEIKNDTIILKDSGIRAILRITGLNLDLKNFDEQQVVLEQYKRFLNGLDFPVQILIRNSYLDLSNYINYVKNNVNEIENKTLQGQGKNYIGFLEDIDMRQGLIYNKEFYIVVPYYQSEQDTKEIQKSWITKLMDTLNSKDNVEKIVERYRVFLKNRQGLETRVNLISDGLASMGIPAEKLTTSEIISLIFKQYNPTVDNAQSQMAE